MRVLLDECMPRKLKEELSDHEVRTVPEAGWASKKNGELLRLADGKFEDRGQGPGSDFYFSTIFPDCYDVKV